MPPDKLTSFIPKTIPDIPARPRAAVGLLTFLGFVLFIISMGLLGGVFFYKRIVAGEIGELKVSLKRLEADFEPTLLSEFIQTADAINTAKDLLSRHRASSKIFKFLEENTLDSVQFGGFSFAAKEAKLTLTGQAESYTALALQSTVFETNSMVKKVVFSNLGLTDKGGVKFSAALDFDPAIISFR